MVETEVEAEDAKFPSDCCILLFWKLKLFKLTGIDVVFVVVIDMTVGSITFSGGIDCEVIKGVGYTIGITFEEIWLIFRVARRGADNYLWSIAFVCWF